MNARSTLMMLVLAAGCARDPELGRLGSGEEALTYHAPENTLKYAQENDRVPMFVAKGTGSFGSSMVFVPLGEKVRVVSDTLVDKREDLGGRNVQIRVIEGEFADKVGLVDRKFLRPVRP